MKREYYGCTCKAIQASTIFQWQPQKQAPSFEGSNNRQSCLQSGQTKMLSFPIRISRRFNN